MEKTSGPKEHRSYNYLFSVIVPTYNRLDEIRELLDSFDQQSIDMSQFEVIIVDDGSVDETVSWVEKRIGESRFRLRLLRQDHRGPGEARNLGMQAAEAEYMLFIDSDCIADANWLKAYEEAVEAEHPGAFGGPDHVLPEFSPLQKSIDYSMTSFLTTGGIRGHSKKKLSKYYPRSFNMGVRSDIVARIGGMNKLRHGQDIEFSHRILGTGQRVIKVDGAVVYHKRRTSLRRFFRQVFNWGVARINLYKIDSGMLEAVHFMPLVGTKIIFLTVLATLFFPYFMWPIWAAGLSLLLGMGIHGVIRYRDIRVLPFIPIIVPTQILGYGIGFGWAFFRRVILGRDAFTGFVKKYYK